MISGLSVDQKISRTSRRRLTNVAFAEAKRRPLTAGPAGGASSGGGGVWCAEGPGYHHYDDGGSAKQKVWRGATLGAVAGTNSGSVRIVPSAAE